MPFQTGGEADPVYILIGLLCVFAAALAAVYGPPPGSRVRIAAALERESAAAATKAAAAAAASKTAAAAAASKTAAAAE